MTVKIEVLGLKEVQDKLNKASSDIKTGISNSMNQLGLFLQGEIKESIAGRRAEPKSVDTGRFLNSVNSTTSENSVAISSDVEYAKFLEYGTSKISARRHFSNTLARNNQKIVDVVKNNIL